MNRNYTEPTQVNWLDKSRHRGHGVKNNKGIDEVKLLAQCRENGQ